MQERTGEEVTDSNLVKEALEKADFVLPHRDSVRVEDYISLGVDRIELVDIPSPNNVIEKPNGVRDRINLLLKVVMGKKYYLRSNLPGYVSVIHDKVKGISSDLNSEDIDLVTVGTRDEVLEEVKGKTVVLGGGVIEMCIRMRIDLLKRAGCTVIVDREISVSAQEARKNP